MEESPQGNRDRPWTVVSGHWTLAASYTWPLSRFPVLNRCPESADDQRVKRKLAVLLLPLVIGACSATSSPPTTFGVDRAPQLLRNTYLTVTRGAATLVGYDATDDQWMEFARTVCAAGLETSQDLADFVDQTAGSSATPDLRQMWTTVATAASTSFCPIG